MSLHANNSHQNPPPALGFVHMSPVSANQCITSPQGTSSASPTAPSPRNEPTTPPMLAEIPTLDAQPSSYTSPSLHFIHLVHVLMIPSPPAPLALFPSSFNFRSNLTLIFASERATITSLLVSAYKPLHRLRLFQDYGAYMAPEDSMRHPSYAKNLKEEAKKVNWTVVGWWVMIEEEINTWRPEEGTPVRDIMLEGIAREVGIVVDSVKREISTYAARMDDGDS